MPSFCDNCLDEIKFYSSNVDSFTGKKFDIHFCYRCSIGRTNLDKNFNFDDYYPKSYYGDKGNKFNLFVELIVLSFRYFRSLFCYRLFYRKNVKLLDIGCGRGNFIYLMKKKKWLVFGTEMSAASGAVAKEKVGNDSVFINKDLSDLEHIGTNFNIITLWHVLEHLPKPKKLINIIEKRLINKGYLVIEVPNFNSIQHFIDKNNWIHLECPRHVTHFSIKGLENFLDSKKFKIIKSSTLSYEFGFYGMLQSLLNLFVPIPNYLFFFILIRNKNAPINTIPLIKNFISFVLTIILFLPLSFISIILELIAILFQRGGIIRIVMQKVV